MVVRADDRVAVVTGAAVRVGRAIATHLAADGWRVWIHHHRSTEQARACAEAIETQHPGAILGTPRADLSTDDGRDALAAAVGDTGRIDLLVNNAASFERGELEARTDDDLRRVLELNLVAPIGLVRRLAPALRSTGGSVVNVLDLGAHRAWRGRLDHCVAKAGLRMATEALALELAPVRVNAVSPGTVAWPEGMSATAKERVRRGIPLGGIGRPEDVAQAVAYLANATHVTGTTIVVDGGRLAGGLSE